ncbi:hypothetical protein V6N12_012752 [Hibiscus sabdariffa]|uniref:RRM domain-containing protein n=1 Tax=Hibiscus sabdariffa TaxID=183260 RepID=A0ABR2EFB4_9ROSI
MIRYKKTTFAFIGFIGESKEKVAIEKGSGRLMDGFHIRVYNVRSGKESTMKSTTKAQVARKCFKSRDFRSYKEVLMSNEKQIRNKSYGETTTMELNRSNVSTETRVWIYDNEKVECNSDNM